jgi:hypothetical protein
MPVPRKASGLPPQHGQSRAKTPRAAHKPRERALGYKNASGAPQNSVSVWGFCWREAFGASAKASGAERCGSQICKPCQEDRAARRD